MMNHNHSAYIYKSVTYHDAPQGIGSDAAVGIAKNGGFCGCVSDFDTHLQLIWLVWKRGKGKREE